MMQRKLWSQLVRECCLANLGAGTQKYESALHFPTHGLPQADLKTLRCLWSTTKINHTFVSVNENKICDWLSKSRGIREIQWLVQQVTWNKRNSVIGWASHIQWLVELVTWNKRNSVIGWASHIQWLVELVTWNKRNSVIGYQAAPWPSVTPVPSLSKEQSCLLCGTAQTQCCQPKQPMPGRENKKNSNFDLTSKMLTWLHVNELFL